METTEMTPGTDLAPEVDATPEAEAPVATAEATATEEATPVAAPKTKAKKPSNKKAPKAAAKKAPKAKKAATGTRKRLTPEEREAEEARLSKKYPRIVKGSFRDIDTNPESKFHNKRSVVIKCATPGCENTRRVATSDLPQVKYCEECTAKRRLERRKKARKLAAKGKKTSKK